MAVRMGAGWELIHVTDRVVELRKPDALYRRYLGRDGFVRVRAEPGMDRAALLDRAMAVAHANDERIAVRYGTREVASLAALKRDGQRVTLEQHRGLQRRLAPTFAVPGQEPGAGAYRP